MPFADPEQRRAAQRESYRRRYWTTKGMREREAKRKAAWFDQDRVRERNRLKKRLQRLKAKRAQMESLLRQPQQAKEHLRELLREAKQRIAALGQKLAA